MPEVWSVSVQTIVFTPPSYVYNKIIIKITKVVAQKGTCKLSRIKNCKIFTTKYNLAVAPNVLDKIKKDAPVLYAPKPNLVSK